MSKTDSNKAGSHFQERRRNPITVVLASLANYNIGAGATRFWLNA